MSVMLSHIDINTQDDVDAELEHEDVKQQQELKAFLEEELDDDDLFDNASFTSTGRLSDAVNHVSGKVQGSRHHINGDIDFDVVAHHSGETNGYEHNNNYEVDSDLYPSHQQSSQLQVLYEARGRKIKSLQMELDNKDDTYSKEIRILNHKLVLATGEKEGALTSMQQLQEILQEHKAELRRNEHLLTEELDKNTRLNQQLGETDEKLDACEETINSLQQQIQMMNQSESLARSRAQHESMLATMRQKHETEILTLKEKLDDMKQALAWKTEDVNRYREMMDSNSTTSELGILQHRLRTEEETTKTLRQDLNTKGDEIKELMTQLEVYESLIQTSHNQLSSTPFGPSSGKGLRRGLLEFKTPITQSHTPGKTDSPQTPQLSKVRNELVNALSSNHEKRKEIVTLKTEVTKLQRQLNQQKMNSQVSSRGQPSPPADRDCDNCGNLKEQLDLQKGEFNRELESLKSKLVEANSSQNDLQTNMVDLVKKMDIKKLLDSNAQNNAMLKFVDDAKETLRTELERAHQSQIQKLETELDKLSGELLYTKEEYVKLCEDMKSLEHQIEENVQNKSKLELEEIRIQMDNEFHEKLRARENELSLKYIDDLDKEKKVWEETAAHELQMEVERSLVLAETEWVAQHRLTKEQEVSSALQLAKMEWEHNLKAKADAQESDVEKLKKSWEEQMEAQFRERLEKEKRDMDAKHKGILDERIKETKEKILIEEGQKLKDELNELIKVKQVELKEKTQSLEHTINLLNQQLNKAEVTLQLKESMFLRNETDLKHSIKLLQNEVKELNERLDSDDSNQSQSSLIFKKIDVSSPLQKIGNPDVSLLENQLQSYKEMQGKWSKRERELVSLLKETSAKLKTMKDTTKCCDCVFQKNSRVTDPTSPSQRTDALELSKQTVASLTSRTEQLETDLLCWKKDFKRLKSEKEEEVRNLRLDFKQDKERCEEEFSNERKIMEEKHDLEVQKILLVEERKRGKLRKDFEKEHENLRNKILRDGDHPTLSQRTDALELSKQTVASLTSRNEQLETDLLCVKEDFKRLKSEKEEEVRYRQDVNVNERIKTLKEKHVTDVKKLKKNFCDKLEKINQAKANWMKEEQAKREKQEKEFDIKLLGVQNKYEGEIEKQSRQWQRTLEEAVDNHKNTMSRLKEEHRFAMIRLTEEHNDSRLKLEKDMKNSSREFNAKQQELNLVRNQYQQMMAKVKTLEDASIFDSQSESSISPPTNHKSPSIKFSQSTAPPLSSLIDNASKNDEAIPNMKSIESLRAFYLQSVKNMQEDLVTYTQAMRQKFGHEIREAVRRERKNILFKINASKRKESVNGYSQDEVRQKSTRDHIERKKSMSDEYSEQLSTS